MTRLDALLALLTFPFVITCVLAIVAAVWLAWHHEARQDANPYLAPWRDREPGDLS